MKKKLSLLTLLSATLLLGACKKESESSNDTTTLNVRLTDAPGDFDKVNIEVVGISVLYAQGDTNSGWMNVAVTPHVYNLLDLTNGKDTLLGSQELPTGNITQIRLLLGDNNSVVVDGQTYPLKTPSAQQSGLKLKVNAQLVKNIDYSLTVDFDAGRSIVQTGNGKYILKPVLRAFATAVDGAIAGTINPNVPAAAYAIQGQDTVGSYTSTSGQFLIKGLSGGNYNLLVVPQAPYLIYTQTNVAVNNGQITNLGTITVTQ